VERRSSGKLFEKSASLSGQVSLFLKKVDCLNSHFLLDRREPRPLKHPLVSCLAEIVALCVGSGDLRKPLKNLCPTSQTSIFFLRDCCKDERSARQGALMSHGECSSTLPKRFVVCCSVALPSVCVLEKIPLPSRLSTRCDFRRRA